MKDLERLEKLPPGIQKHIIQATTFEGLSTSGLRKFLYTGLLLICCPLVAQNMTSVFKSETSETPNLILLEENSLYEISDNAIRRISSYKITSPEYEMKKQLELRENLEQPISELVISVEGNPLEIHSRILKSCGSVTHETPPRIHSCEFVFPKNEAVELKITYIQDLYLPGIESYEKQSSNFANQYTYNVPVGLGLGLPVHYGRIKLDLKGSLFLMDKNLPSCGDFAEWDSRIIVYDLSRPERRNCTKIILHLQSDDTDVSLSD